MFWGQRFGLSISYVSKNIWHCVLSYPCAALQEADQHLCCFLRNVFQYRWLTWTVTSLLRNIIWDLSPVKYDYYPNMIYFSSCLLIYETYLTHHSWTPACNFLCYTTEFSVPLKYVMTQSWHFLSTKLFTTNTIA